MSERIILKPVEPEDVDFMLECESDRQASLWSDYRAPFSRRMLLDYALSYDADPFSARQIRFIICLPDGTRAGIIDLFELSEKDGRGSVGICTHPAYRNKGIAFAALESLKEYTSERLGLHQIVGKVAVSNQAAQNLFLKSGFTEIARLPSWHRIGKEFHDFSLFAFIL